MTPKESNLSVPDNNLNFEEFSGQPEYVEVNRGLVKQVVLKLPVNFCHVDVATGTGLVPRLIIEEATKENKKGEIKLPPARRLGDFWVSPPPYWLNNPICFQCSFCSRI